MYWIKKQMHDFRVAPSGEKGFISAIIPVYGKKLSTIVETIRCLSQQRYEKLEIIIVSNGVDEGMFQSNGVSVPKNGKIVYLKKNMGAAYARNAGAMNARGEILWFIDSDVSGISPESAGHALEIFDADQKIGALGGVVFHGSDNFSFVVGRIKDEYQERYPNAEALLDDDFVNKACIFVRRRVFNAVQGFADFIEYPFDDVDFGYKIRSAGFRCVGAFPCAGIHPLYAPQNNIFYDFMTFHNLMLHLFISYRIGTFKALLKKKREMKWRMAPPSKKSNESGRSKAIFYKLCGLFLSASWLTVNIFLVIKLRRERQRLLCRLRNSGGVNP